MIEYVYGDATDPRASDGPRVICHVCNNRGAWGAGFVLAVSRRWPEPERQYRAAASADDLYLGDVQLCPVAPGLKVANLIAQDGFPSSEKPCVLEYWALESGLRWLASFADPDWSFHMPRIGCGIAGGSWPIVEKAIGRTIAVHHSVTVYDLRLS